MMGIWLEGNTGLRIFLSEAFGAAYGVQAAIGAGTCHVVLEHDCFTFFRADQRGVHIALLVSARCVIRVFPEFVFGIFCHTELPG